MNTKSFKKTALALLVLALLLCSIVGLSLSTLSTTIPANTDTHSFTINNVANGSVAKAYKVIEPVYGTYGVTGYQAVSGVTIADISAPTKAEIETIVTAITSGTTTLPVAGTFTAASNKVTGSLGAGSYIILINSNRATSLYNPIFVSLQYTNSSDASTLGQTVSEDSFRTDSDFTVNATTYWAKTSTITNPGTYSRTNIKMKDHHYANGVLQPLTRFDYAGIGDDIHFVAQAEVPKYTSAYQNPQFWIKNEFEAGFNIPTSSNPPVVSLMDIATSVSPSYTSSYGVSLPDDFDALTALDSSYYTIEYSIDSYTVKFNKDFLMSDLVQNMEYPQIVIEFTSQLNDNAEIYHNATGYLNNDISTFADDCINRTRLLTYLTTDMFAQSMDSPVLVKNASSCPSCSVGSLELDVEFCKVSDGGSVSKEYISPSGYTPIITNPLAGATFRLTKIKEFNTEPYVDQGAQGQTVTRSIDDYTDTAPLTYTTTSNGQIIFQGLGVGVYKLEEIAAPTGYNTDNRTMYIAFVPCASSGAYKVYATFNEDALSQIVVTYGNSIIVQTDSSSIDTVCVIVSDKAVGAVGSLNPYAIVNTSQLTLPTTGGNGTKIYVIIGILMILSSVAIIYIKRYNIQRQS